jgi:hypothetical protein
MSSLAGLIAAMAVRSESAACFDVPNDAISVVLVLTCVSIAFRYAASTVFPVTQLVLNGTVFLS